MLSFFPRGVLDEILNLIESGSEEFPSLLCYVDSVINSQIRRRTDQVKAFFIVFAYYLFLTRNFVPFLCIQKYVYYMTSTEKKFKENASTSKVCFVYSVTLLERPCLLQYWKILLLNIWRLFLRV